MAFLWFVNRGYYVLTKWDDPPSGFLDLQTAKGTGSFRKDNSKSSLNSFFDIFMTWNLRKKQNKPQMLHVWNI